MSAPLLLLDGASMWFRSYYGVPSSITSPDGRPVNAVRGFLDSVAMLITRQRPGRLVVCLDLDWRPQFRVDRIPSYKAHRVEEEHPDGKPDVEEVPDELSPQVEMIEEILDTFGICTGGAAGFEADDVIGALAARERRDPVIVVSGDRDLLQVVGDDPVSVRVLYLGRGLTNATMMGPREVAERTAIANLRAAAPLVERAGMKILVEAINTFDMPGYFASTPDIAASLVRAAESDSVGSERHVLLFPWAVIVDGQEKRAIAAHPGDANLAAGSAPGYSVLDGVLN